MIEERTGRHRFLQVASSNLISICLEILWISRKPTEIELLGKVRALNGRDKDISNAQPNESEHNQPSYNFSGWLVSRTNRVSGQTVYQSLFVWAGDSYWALSQVVRLCIIHKLIGVDFLRCWENVPAYVRKKSEFSLIRVVPRTICRREYLGQKRWRNCICA